ncbi:SDR family NAD(P)-dependent oxidoreductase [Rhodocytophaga aerolata]|uniref:SDR family NAD(P)-dependent oxidoreductase n=1 Tax=Rhodocytophaga aerolata TaxID=455078 RepID=A0ABT8QYH3_9BACT|nr:SDR family NAD(P)-dependent oxidoreductase [Rhodocytophaga aerolata]MDO1444891.1 SDR family NAD(P)-dependent oxidoreductase [Rhodocytophaga aerolata]
MEENHPQALYIITGCSKGIGKALLNKILSYPHAAVIGISRTPMKSRERFTNIQADLSDWQALVNKLASIFPDASFYSKVVLINNAAWIGELKHIGKLDNASIARVYASNCVAPAILMNAFAQQYAHTTKEKLVINVSTSAGRNPRDGMSMYGSTKAALDMLTKVARQEAEISNSGISYYILSVGATDTPMQDAIRETTQDNFSTLQRFIDLKNSNGLLTAEEVANHVWQLLQTPIQAEDGYIYIKK